MSEAIDLHAAAFEAVHRWWRAWIERDSRAVEEMAAAECMERNDRGRLKTLGSGRLIEVLSCQEEDCSITDWELSDPVTRLFEHLIVCSYTFRFSGKRGNQSFMYEGCATVVLSRKDGRWIFVSHEGVLEGGRLVG